MSQTNQQPVLLAVSAPPFWHCGRTVKKASYAMLLALAPASFMAVWHWGIPAAPGYGTGDGDRDRHRGALSEDHGPGYQCGRFFRSDFLPAVRVSVARQRPLVAGYARGSAGDWPRQDGLRRVGSQRCQHRARRLGHVVRLMASAHGPERHAARHQLHRSAGAAQIFRSRSGQPHRPDRPSPRQPDRRAGRVAGGRTVHRRIISRPHAAPSAGKSPSVSLWAFSSPPRCTT